jgi:hypothetical protein
MKSDFPKAPEWIPESAFRDTLLVQKLPAALRDKNLFWINVRRYLTHNDAHLPAEDYLRHWKEIYDSCLSDDCSLVRRVSYLSFEPPAETDIH